MNEIRYGACAVIYSEEKGEKKYLVFHRVLNWTGWELLKGGYDDKPVSIAAKENELMRELWEEAGLEHSDFKIEKMLNVKLDFNLQPKAASELGHKRAHYDVFLVKAFTSNVHFRNNDVIEHDEYKWLPFREAVDTLTFENQKEILKIAEGGYS